MCKQHPDIFFCSTNQKGFLPRYEVAKLPRPQAIKRRIKRRVFGRMKFNCPLEGYRDEQIVAAYRTMQGYHDDRAAKMYSLHNNNMKFLLSVRNPIDRTYSQYVKNMNARMEKGDPRRTFDINQELGIEQPQVQTSLIYSLLEPYLDLFSLDQFIIYPMELMIQDPEHWLNKVFAFLGVQQLGPLGHREGLTNPGKYDAETFVPMSDASK